MTAFKKARLLYFQRCDELEKAKAVKAKAVDDTVGIKTLDKRRKSKDEAQTKVNFSLVHCISITCKNAEYHIAYRFSRFVFMMFRKIIQYFFL